MASASDMCGIAGILNTEAGSMVEAETIHRMCQTIVHRGPDDEGIYAKDGVGLGIRRLSIIDLAGGHQPVHNENETVWVVFNGEVYNFPELRLELESRGHCFYTSTDTEVIAHLYEDLGADCVHKLRGMFAFALYDERQHRLLLARDRLGKKPLHYALLGNRFFFGSEIKALLAAAPELCETNPGSFLPFFYFGYIPDPDTAFTHVKKLPPGHLLELVDGQIKLRQYWDLPAYGTHKPLAEEECLEELERRLAEAARIRLISDVPLGALLSGGTDSSTVVALMARATSKPVKTFSIGFRSQDFNEADYAREVAQRFGTEHHELIVEPNFGETLGLLTRSLEEPFFDSSILPTFYVCRLARQHVTVALSGDGGDELFAGYERYGINLRRRMFDLVPDWAGRTYRERVYPHLPRGVLGRRLVFNASLPGRERYLDQVSVLRAFDRERSLFSPDFLALTNNCNEPLELFRNHFEKAPARDALSRLLYLDTKTYLPGDILTKVDRMSMAASLEVRVPLLDHVLVEWVTTLPADLKFRGGKRKYLLKRLAERVGVPREVVYRRKQGFSLPLGHWMRGELREELLGLLLEPRSVQRGYFNPQALRQMLDEHLRGRRDYTGRLWLLLIFELWHRNFFETAQAGRQILSPAPPVVGAVTGKQPEGAGLPAVPSHGAGKL